MFLALLAGAGCGRERNPAMSLQLFETVYVPIDPASFLSLDQALADKGYGHVMASDMKTTYRYHEGYLIVYTDVAFIPSGTSVQPMRVRQCYEAVLADEQAQGLYVNPDVPGRRGYPVSKSELSAALPKLPRRDPAPWEIRIKQ